MVLSILRKNMTETWVQLLMRGARKKAGGEEVGGAAFPAESRAIDQLQLIRTDNTASPRWKEYTLLSRHGKLCMGGLKRNSPRSSGGWEVRKNMTETWVQLLMRGARKKAGGEEVGGAAFPAESRAIDQLQLIRTDNTASPRWKEYTLLSRHGKLCMGGLKRNSPRSSAKISSESDWGCNGSLPGDVRVIEEQSPDP